VAGFVFVVFALVSIPDGQRAILAVFACNTRANIQPCVFGAGHAFLSSTVSAAISFKCGRGTPATTDQKLVVAVAGGQLVTL
jgi:hypothetical protein